MSSCFPIGGGGRRSLAVDPVGDDEPNATMDPKRSCFSLSKCCSSIDFSWQNRKVRVTAVTLLAAALITAAVFAGIKANSFDTSFTFCPTSVADLHLRGILISTSVGLSFTAASILVLSKKLVNGEKKNLVDPKSAKSLLKDCAKLFSVIVVGAAAAGICGISLLAVGILGVVALIKEIRDDQRARKEHEQDSLLGLPDDNDDESDVTYTRVSVPVPKGGRRPTQDV